MAQPASTGALLIAGLSLAVIAMLFSIGIFGATSGSTVAGACTGAGAATTVDPSGGAGMTVAGYSGGQLTNAALIMNAATAAGLDRPAQIVGVMTAMGESSLIVLDHGDAIGPDSRGLFQQRDNGAWGSLEERMDPTISATNFFTALSTVPRWAEMAPSIAAHRVQGNADPYHYESFIPAANQVVAALAGDTPQGCGDGTTMFPLSAGFTMTDGYGPRISPVAGASSWHPAVDVQHYPNPCGDEIYAITAGTVALIAGYQITIVSPDGYTVSYLHMTLSDVSVTVGQSVAAGQKIALVGSEGPSTGCHLDLRINASHSINAAVSALPRAESLGGPVAAAGYVNPQDYFAIFGMDLCAAAHCTVPGP